MEKDLDDLMKYIANFCDKYKVDVEVETFAYTITNEHKVRINVRKGN